MIKISTEYLEHEGGTKFYEIVVVAVEGGPALVLNRWGKMEHAKRSGAGQVKRESCVSGAAGRQAMRAKFEEKSNRGYAAPSAKGPRFGIHLYVDRDLTVRSAAHALADHYGVAMADSILAELGVDTTGIAVSPSPTASAPKRPEPKIERGEDWGAWA